MGHLARGAEDQLSLTELGWHSVRDGRRYTHSVRDRRPVLFDGFAGKPLRGAYYDDETVTFLDAAKLAGLLANASGAAAEEVFTPVMPIPLLAPGQEAVAGMP